MQSIEKLVQYPVLLLFVIYSTAVLKLLHQCSIKFTEYVLQMIYWKEILAAMFCVL